MSREEKVMQMHEALKQAADPRSHVHIAYKAKMKEILWIYTSHLTDVLAQIPDDSDRAREIVTTFIEEFVENNFNPVG